MRSELERKVRALLDDGAKRVSAPANKWPEIEQRLAGRPERDRRRWMLGVAVAVVGAVAAVVVVPGWLVSPEPVTVQDTLGRDSEPPTSSPSPSASEPASTEAPAYTWKPVMASAGQLPDGLLGGDAFADGDMIVVATNGALWRSLDGAATWTQVGGEVVEPSSQPHDIRALVGTPNELVAAGGIFTQGVVWRSTDGSEWQRIEVPGSGLLYDIVYADGQLVVSGRNGIHAAAYVSNDGGLTWSAADVEASDQGRENGMFVLAHGPAGWVATGYGPGAAGLSAIWVSSDARTWNLVPETGIVGDIGVIDAIAADEHGYVALRAGGQVYTSTDARRWTEVAQLSSEHAPAGSTVRFAGLVRTHQGWLATGGPPDATSGPYAYTSVDGVVWSVSPIADKGMAQVMALRGDGTAFVAGVGGPWIGTPTGDSGS